MITDRYYIGMHETSNIEDGYLGSGRRLKASVKKHGKKNHVRTILHTLNSRDDMIAKEIEIVTENLLKDPLCFNMKVGGHGGGSGHMTAEHKQMLLETNLGQSKKGSSSKHCGVAFDKSKTTPWLAQIKRDGRVYGLGFFKTELEAHEWREKQIENGYPFQTFRYPKVINTETNELFYSINEAAKDYGTTAPYFCRLLKKGIIKYKRTGL